MADTRRSEAVKRAAGTGMSRDERRRLSNSLRSIRRRGQLAERDKAPSLVIRIGDSKGKDESDDEVTGGERVSPAEARRNREEDKDMKNEKKKGGTKGKKKGKGGY